jgi:hypothetical protein
MPAKTKSSARTSFHKEMLPSPGVFYRQEFGQRLRRSSRQGWAVVPCVFHQPDRHPSLNVNLVHGGFLCFACGARGGDVVDFVQLRDGLSFRAAAAALGALADDSEQARLEMAQRKRERERAQALAEAQRDAEHQLMVELRGDVHFFEKMLRDAGTHLEKPDREDWWELMASVQDLLRWAIAGYMVMAFGSQSLRADYLQNLDRRTTIETEVLLQGWVQDDEGHIMEVTA